MPQSNSLVSNHPLKGKAMAAMVHHRIAPPIATNPSYTPIDPAESQRNYNVASQLRGLSIGSMQVRRVVLPKDANPNVSDHEYIETVKHAQAYRNHEHQRQSAVPWYSFFMHTSTDAQRLNNPAQASAMRQRQLTVPSTYGQFYAFMHALSAAFGQMK
jgi:hypothetical protein